ncbi:DUF3892 domain-containing protein [Pseudescherichia sp.]|uniref:DUF3892 domain-containing protein n=1 Tax=Pseudescherichia sp. TaxID=2055881 RepID=UPI00390C6FF9
MSNYYVYAVRYNSNHSHIDVLRVSQGGGVSVDLRRQEVVSRIFNETDVFITAIQRSDGQYYQGARVIIDPVGGNFYLKTVADGIARDNLEQLPQF